MDDPEFDEMWQGFGTLNINQSINQSSRCGSSLLSLANQVLAEASTQRLLNPVKIPHGKPLEPFTIPRKLKADTSAVPCKVVETSETNGGPL